MVSELEIIRKLRTMFPSIGDDAVVLMEGRERVNRNLSSGKLGTLIASVDTFVEGEHFDLAYFSPYDVGYKALAASISDIAACGGIPKYALVSIGLKKGDIEFVDALYKGIKDVSEAYGVEVIGGDTTKSHTIFVSVAVTGETNRFVGRNGARVGNVICVTGELGGAPAGLIALKKGIKSSLTKFHLYPTPRVKEGIVLAKYATSMIDISDGLMIDLSHILEESKVCAKLWCSKLPINKEAKRIAKKLSVPLWEVIVNGGEDFELLFTVPPRKIDRAKKEVRFTEVGEIVESKCLNVGSKIIDEDGKEIPITGFDHFNL